GAVDFLEILDDVLPELRAADPGALRAAACPRLRHVIVESDDPYRGCLRLADVLDDATDPELARALEAARRAVLPDDPLTILYTSGTTSFPKGAVITHRNAVPHGLHCGRVMRLTPDDRVLHALPFSGTWGGLCIPLAAWGHGAVLVLMDTFEAGRA